MCGRFRIARKKEILEEEFDAEVLDDELDWVPRYNVAPVQEIAVVRRLMRRYADVPMSLADACLVRMCELDDRAAVMTLDSDFRRYRKHGQHVIAVVSPDG